MSYEAQVLFEKFKQGIVQRILTGLNLYNQLMIDSPEFKELEEVQWSEKAQKLRALMKKSIWQKVQYALSLKELDHDDVKLSPNTEKFKLVLKSCFQKLVDIEHTRILQ